MDNEKRLWITPRLVTLGNIQTLTEDLDGVSPGDDPYGSFLPGY
ncbi:MAG: hypothetical protein WCI87_07965 [Euryarchaeota archaeon]